MVGQQVTGRCPEEHDGHPCQLVAWHRLLGIRHRWEQRSDNPTYHSTWCVVWH